MWLPDVITSTPAANSASAVDEVRPMPPARFSPFAVTKSIDRSSRIVRSSPSTASRPGLPMTSPIIRTRQAPAGRSVEPFAGFPRRTRPATRGLEGSGIRPRLASRALALVDASARYVNAPHGRAVAKRVDASPDRTYVLFPSARVEVSRRAPQEPLVDTFTDRPRPGPIGR